MSDLWNENRIDQIRARIDRAFLSLREANETEAAAPIDAVVLSRLVIALNTIATELHTTARSHNADCRDACLRAADFLWSVGEQAGKHDPSLFMQDEVRPTP
ncbi:MAG: hypothetical protein K2X31_06460 [Sphingopyxis sp.]|nr:hypothetical protein [Sphingopyxis sp.]